MIRRQCQMEGIAAGGGGHQPVSDVGLDDLDDGWVDGQQRKIVDERQPRRAVFRGAILQLVASLITNSCCPAASAHHRRVQSRRATMSGVSRVS